MRVKVVSLHIYPVKSLRGVEVTSAEVERRGLALDRRWMVVGPDGMFFSQRKLPKMALIDCEPSATGLRLRAANLPVLEVPLDPSGPRRIVQVWCSRVAAREVSADAAQWLTEVLGMDCSLVKLDPNSRRTAKGPETRAGDIVGFADSNPILVTSQESLDVLNSKMTTPLEMRRFRPNIVLQGCAPHEEDSFAQMDIGSVRLRRTRLCGRCIVTTIDPSTGLSGEEPLRALASYRRDGRNVNFGAHFAPDALGRIEVGDAVVTSSTPS